MPNCFHAPNYTDIHHHGLHVTPADSGDNVLLQIAPGDSFQYDFRIPQDQSPGTHWYRPHEHGSVALPVINGMSGGFVVEGGGLDSLVQARGMREHLIAIQQVDSALNLVDPHGPSPNPVVNGRVSPVRVVRPGEVQRWRIVNENVRLTTSYELAFDTASGEPVPSLYDVARDGVQLAPDNYGTTPDRSLLVSPGNRLDVFVEAPQDTGTHELTARIRGNARPQPAPGDRTGHPRPGPPGGHHAVVVRVAGTPVDDSLPTSLPPLPAFLRNLSTAGIADTAVVVFSDRGGDRSPSAPNVFYLGTARTPAMRYDPGQVFVPQSAKMAPTPDPVSGPSRYDGRATDLQRRQGSNRKVSRRRLSGASQPAPPARPTGSSTGEGVVREVRQLSTGAGTRAMKPSSAWRSIRRVTTTREAPALQAGDAVVAEERVCRSRVASGAAEDDDPAIAASLEPAPPRLHQVVRDVQRPGGEEERKRRRSYDSPDGFRGGSPRRRDRGETRPPARP